VAALLLVAVHTSASLCQEATPSDRPPVPGQTPLPGTPPPPTPSPGAPAPEVPTEPVPVIPPPQPFPPPTVPSAPQRVLPPPDPALPPVATFTLQPSVTLSEEYTDNFNLTRRDKQGNFRSTVSPTLRLLINSAFTRGTIAYTFAPSHDTATDDLQLFHSLLGQVEWQANPRWKLTVADTLTRSDQPAEADRLRLRQERQTFTSNIFSLSSDYLIDRVATRQTYQLSTFSEQDGVTTTSHLFALNASVPIYQTNHVSAGYDYLVSKTSDSAEDRDRTGAISDSSGRSDISGHQLTLAATRQSTTFRSIGVKGSYALRTVTGQHDDVDYSLWNVSAFTNYVLPGRLTINGSLGVSGLVIESGDTLGPNLFSATTIRYQFARTVVTLSVDRGFSETFAEGENFGVVETEGITGTVSHAFTPALSGTATAFYRRNKTTDAGGTVSLGSRATGTERTESWGGTVALSLRLTRNLLFDLTYSYLNQDSSSNVQGVSTTGQTRGDGSYAENRVRAAVTIGF
jgi:hypothetical protein